MTSVQASASSSAAPAPAPSPSSAGIITVQSIRFDKHGAIADVLKPSEDKLDIRTLAAGMVAVKMLAAPINPADIAMIEGQYKLLPSLPAVPGNEGVGSVLKTADDVKDLKPGDRVVIMGSTPLTGTWRSHLILKATELIPVGRTVDLASAATVVVNPSTAFRLLTDFATMKPGDVVVQNAATGGVGQAVIQIARIKGLKSINLYRARPDAAGNIATEGWLKELGADVVVNEDQFKADPTYKQLILTQMQGLGAKPVLAINGIGGPSVDVLIQLLGEKGKFVTYGAMAKAPITINPTAFIFQQISMHGFWLSGWAMSHSREEMRAMILQLLGIMQEGRLKASVTRVPFNQFDRALLLTLSGFRQKVLLVFPD